MGKRRFSAGPPKLLEGFASRAAQEDAPPKDRREAKRNSMSDKTPSIESSSLLKRIRQKLDSLTLSKARMRFSVADEPRWEPSENGEQVLVRWACWTIESDGQEVTAPEYEPLSKEVTRTRLEIDLPTAFPDIDVVVENDVEVSDADRDAYN